MDGPPGLNGPITQGMLDDQKKVIYSTVSQGLNEVVDKVNHSLTDVHAVLHAVRAEANKSLLQDKKPH